MKLIQGIDVTDPTYDQWCNDTQLAAFEAVRECGSVNRAAGKLGKSRCSIRDNIRAVKGKAAKAGYSPSHDMVHTAPDGYKLKGTSTLYGKDGKPKLQWVKTKVDEERQQQMMEEAVAALSEDLPRYDPAPSPKTFDSDLLCQYTITDFHLGMLSWHEETSADWDLEIAERTLTDWFAQAIRQAPASGRAVFAQIGDFLHWDGMEAVTPTHGHVLDADSRFQKLVRAAIRVTRRVINMLLAKHEHVHIVMCTGNHDLSSAVWLREWLAVCYEVEPRVSVDRSPDVYYAYEFGNVALFYHHGHKRKPHDVDRVFAGKFKKIFGDCKHCEAHMGHLHHDLVLETPLMRVNQHRTIAAPDSHASAGGWLSGRDAKVITYHRQHGRVGEIVINSDMVK